MGKMGNNKYVKMLITLCFVLLVVATTMLVLPTVTWLSKTDNSTTNTGTSKVATAGVALYNNTTLINEGSSYTVTLGASGSATSLNLKVKNTGTASCLLRLYYNIKTSENQTLTSADATVVINSNFIAHEKLGTAHCGYLFYNAALDAAATINIFTSITPTANMANKQIVVQLSAESVVYAGNPYTTGETTKYPWSSIPDTWFCL